MEENAFSERVQNIGGSAYIVGGWVRDTVMRRQPHDRDYVVCGAAESDFIKEFPDAVKVGRSFPVYLLGIGGAKCEVAFARTEKKNGSGYRGFEIFSSTSVTIEDDLYRRDTTLNSMAYDIKTARIIDPYNGAKDIESKTIRAVSEHFLDDPVRALRAARQAAQFGFAVEPHTIEMMGKCASELADEPGERIVGELEKALASSRPSIFFRVLDEAGLLKVIFPHIYDLKGKTQPAAYHPEGDSFEHTMMVVDMVAASNSRIEVRFAGLMHDIGKGRTPLEMLPHHYGHEERGAEVLKEINSSLPIPRRWYKCAEFAALEHMRAPKLGKPGKMAVLLRTVSRNMLGADGFSAIIEADGQGYMPEYLKHYDQYIKAMDSVDGEPVPPDLKGPQIGDLVRQREIKAFIEAYNKNKGSVEDGKSEK